MGKKSKFKQKKSRNIVEVSAAENSEEKSLEKRKNSNSGKGGVLNKCSERQTSSELVVFGAEKDGKPLEKKGLM